MASPSNWTKLQDIFHQALAIPPDSRSTFLAEACNGDDALRQQLEGLLQSAGSGDSDFYQTAVGQAAESVFAKDQAVPGDRLGPYQLIRPLGQGGMGSVFLAARADGAFEKEVAIKLVRAGFDSPAARERFRTERQILAALDHPNIARLLDGGEGSRGEPYVVMEYIEGVPLDVYCKQNTLGVAERVDLFRRICSAVSYAHRRLVVHRDIKPANILIGADGVPKLVDFGIAKLLDTADPAASLTRAGERAMTLDYASPEQILGQPITTASDIYSLGVVLYELLTGKPPYRLHGARPSEVERTICVDDPVRPSTSVARAGAEVPDANRLARRLRGDLDNIILKAMRKEPDRRYASVDELAEDLRRHREGYPVLAQPDTWQYRAGKFLSRNRAAVGIGVAVAASLAFAFVAVIRERNTAQAERAKAEQVSKFLVESFRVVDPSESRGRTLTAREVLQQGAERVDRELQSQPGMRATILRTISEVYASIGLYPDSQNLVERAIQARAAAGESESPEAVEDEIQLGRILLTRGNAKNSIAQYKKALAKPDAKAPERRSRLLYHMGMANADAGAWEESKSAYEQSLALRRQLGDQALVAQTLFGMADLQFRRSDYTGTLNLGTQAYEIRRQLFQGNHPAVAESLQQMAMAQDALGKLEEGLRLGQEALKMRRAIFGENHAVVAMNLNDMASFYLHAKRFQESIDAHLQSIAIYKKVFGEKHPLIATALDNLGATYYEMRETKLEEQVKSQAMEMRRELFGEGSMEHTASLSSWAVMLFSRSRFNEALSYATRTLELRRKFHGPDAHTVGVAAINLASTYERMGRSADAIPFLQEALGIFRKRLGDKHPTTARTMALLGTCYSNLGNRTKAEEWYRQSITSYGNETPSFSWTSFVGLGELLLAKGDLAAAEPLLEKAHEIAKKNPKQVGFGRGLADSALGRLKLRKGQKQEGLALILAARPDLERAKGAPRCATELALNRKAAP
ncbi:hypothetical protein F183_A21780 [Bryobacterales bacterium F-183]|nr:hypothetical protein F183_A21780 [Bryobacterales bacterium F-183]